MIRKHLVFYGSVQGVGFRYRAEHAAAHFRCTGWARNEYDGTVTMELQGREADIEQVIQTIGRGMFIQIERVDETLIPVIEEIGFTAY